MTSVYAFLAQATEEAKAAEHTEEQAALLEPVIKAYTTLLVLGDLQGGADLQRLEPALSLCLDQVVASEQDIAVPGILNLRARTTYFANRFLYSHPSETLALAATKTDLQTFLLRWLSAMQYVFTPQFTLMNTLAILKLVAVLPAEVVLQFFERWMRVVVPELRKCADAKEGFAHKPRERPRDRRKVSARSDELMKNSSVSPDLLEAFRAAVLGLEQRSREKGLPLLSFEDQALQEHVVHFIRAN